MRFFKFYYGKTEKPRMRLEKSLSKKQKKTLYFTVPPPQAIFSL